ncbi:MAG: hypothetical protein HC880_00835 [Bacteroidia bacterium]|nr:hypothetical protein [Bacteroidia bacterium]
MLFVYQKTFKFDFSIDDKNFINRKKREKSWQLHDKSIKGVLWYIKYHLYGAGTFGDNPRNEHIFQTCLNAAACVLIYYAFGSNNVSFWTAILYAVNPINNQTSIWLNGKRYLINIIIVMLMMILGPVGILIYPLTAFFQVNAIFAPIIYGIGSWYLLLFIPVFWLICGKEIREKIKMRKSILHNDDMKTFKPKKIIPIVKLFGAYMMKMVVPGQTLMWYPTLFFWGLTEKGNKDAYAINLDFLKGCIVIALSIAGAFYFKNDIWLYLFMILSVLQWSGFITVTQLLTDRYVSLANVFMMYFLTNITIQNTGDYANIILACICTYYYQRLQITFMMYKNIWSFYDYQIFFYPDNPKPYEFKADRLIVEKQDILGAWQIVKAGLERCPDDMKLNLLAALCMHQMGDKPSVLMYIRHAKKHPYVGQEFIVRDYMHKIFGIDLQNEVQKINEKKSTFDRKQRDNIVNIYNAIENTLN